MPFKPTTSYFLQSWQFCYDMRGVSIPQHPTLLISALHWRKSTNPGAARASWATQPPCCLEKEKHVFSKYIKGAINVYRWKFPAKTRCHSNVRLKTALDTTWPSEHNLDDFLHPSMHNFKFLLWTSTQFFFMVRYSTKETFAVLGMVSHISLCSMFRACWAS